MPTRPAAHRRSLDAAAPGLAPPQRCRARFALEMFPLTFRDEVQQYLGWREDPPDPLARAWKRGTVRQVRTELRLAASALAHARRGTEHVRQLADLVAPGNAKLILGWYIKEQGGQPTAFVERLAANLFALGRDWLKLPARELEELRALKRRIAKSLPARSGARAGVQRQLQDPVVRARLLELPETLAREARGARRRSPAKRLHQMRTAIAFELVLETGMRSPELADLRVEQVQPPADGVTNGCILAVATDGMGSRCDYQLSAPCAARVLDYIEHFRPSTTSSRPRALLFVQRHGRPVTSTALADAIKKATKRHLGVALAPSHLRHFVATLYLQSNPGDLSGLKDLLGHRHLQTTALLYGHLGTIGAAASWAARLDQGFQSGNTVDGRHG